MVTSEQAEALARIALRSYVENCNIETTEDIANALMKLVSVAGVTMLAHVGQDEAVARLQGTTNFVAGLQVLPRH